MASSPWLLRFPPLSAWCSGSSRRAGPPASTPSTPFDMNSVFQGRPEGLQLRTLIAAALAASVAVAGCAVKHPYVAPVASVPPAWEGDGPVRSDVGQEALAAWWGAFN